jgi:hypothetical protein
MEEGTSKMSELELALKELESATAAVTTLSEDDYAENQAALDRCAWALRDLAALGADVPSISDELGISRLRGNVTQ